MTEMEARAIQSMSVDELEVELVLARVEAKKHATCTEHAGCHLRADAVVDALLDEWKSRHTAPVAR